ncbi:MAG: translation initiation factor, partial [Bacteroidota bacterium]
QSQGGPGPLKNRFMSNKINLSGFVFSTDPDYKPAEEEKKTSAVPLQKQALRIWLERGRGGKESTVIKGFEGSDEALSELARVIKNKCAAGGSAKDGIIIVQGDHRDKVLKLLTDAGYTNVKKAGG